MAGGASSGIDSIDTDSLTYSKIQRALSFDVMTLMTLMTLSSVMSHGPLQSVTP